MTVGTNVFEPVRTRTNEPACCLNIIPKTRIEPCIQQTNLSINLDSLKQFDPPVSRTQRTTTLQPRYIPDLHLIYARVPPSSEVARA